MGNHLRSMDRKVRFWSVAALASLVGLRVAVNLYSGPSIGVGISVALGIGVAVGLLSLWFGERFWRVIGHLFFFVF